MSVTKIVKKYGNSGGIYLPAEWVGGKVKIELVEQPLNPKKDLLGSLPLEHVVSLILYGSYVRGEMTEDSDIDVILVTDGEKTEIPQDIRARYDIQVKGVEQLKLSVTHDPLFHKILCDEAIALVNGNLLDEIRAIKPETRSINTRIELIESSLGIVKEMLELGADGKDVVYPLVLRIKEALLMECFLENKKYNTKALRKSVLKNCTPAEFSSLMSIYRNIRDDKKPSNLFISENTTGKLVTLLEAKIQNVKQKKLKERH